MIDMLGFIIWSSISVLFVALGIRSRCSKKAVGFWANSAAPEVTDVKKYNRAVSNVWLFLAIGFELLGIPLINLRQNSPIIILLVLGPVFLMIIGMVLYTFVESKYRK